MDEKERVRYYTDIIAATLERTTRRIIVLCVVIAVVLSAAVIYLERSHKKEHEELVASLNAQNERWIQMWEEYDFESYTTEYTQDGRGLNIIGDGNGVDYNGPALQNDAENAE